MCPALCGNSITPPKFVPVNLLTGLLRQSVAAQRWEPVRDSEATATRTRFHFNFQKACKPKNVCMSATVHVHWACGGEQCEQEADCLAPEDTTNEEQRWRNAGAGISSFFVSDGRRRREQLPTASSFPIVSVSARPYYSAAPGDFKLTRGEPRFQTPLFGWQA